MTTTFDSGVTQFTWPFDGIPSPNFESEVSSDYCVNDSIEHHQPRDVLLTIIF